MSKRIIEVLMKRDGMSEEEAKDLIEEAKEELQEILEEEGSLEDAYDICEAYFGLEPDYLEDLL